MYMSARRDRTDIMLKFLAVCGIIGPILYAMIVLIIGFLRPGYNHVTQYMSELGEVGSPNAILMNIAGFIVLGLFIIAFSFGLHRGIDKSKESKIGSALLVLAGISLVLVGFFPCDPGCVNISFTSKMHEIFATIPAVATIVAILLFTNSFKQDSRWKDYWIFTLLIGIVALIVSPLSMLNLFGGLGGLLQRIGMMLPLFWMEITSIKLYRLECS